MRARTATPGGFRRTPAPRPRPAPGPQQHRPGDLAAPAGTVQDRSGLFGAVRAAARDWPGPDRACPGAARARRDARRTWPEALAEPGGTVRGEPESGRTRQGAARPRQGLPGPRGAVRASRNLPAPGLGHPGPARPDLAWRGSAGRPGPGSVRRKCPRYAGRYGRYGRPAPARSGRRAAGSGHRPRRLRQIVRASSVSVSSAAASDLAARCSKPASCGRTSTRVSSAAIRWSRSGVTPRLPK